ncbi:hypothetical protein F2P56_003578 [Juglans regia]|uniref:CCHC-type domain-containing protein n=1 Tax=Juglans regia TaxID=51240 RepID=A0A833Y582_JUGRE|nr:hypothetical protein F2P56_003578 [Juglans regia]
MRMTLFAKNKLGFVNGSVLKPSNPTDPTLASWIRYNNMFVLKKERPVCKHCGLVGHVIEKCFKLREFSPRYKFKPRQQSMANQVVSNNTSSVAYPISLTESQYQQLLAMLQSSDPAMSFEISQHTANAVSSVQIVGIGTSDFYTSFVFSSTSVIPTNLDSSYWILDSGATDHMVPSTYFFPPLL